MNKKGIILLFLIIIFFNGCTQDNSESQKLKLQNQNKIEVDKLSTQNPAIGSTQYVDELSDMAKRKGYKAAILRIMDDVGKYSQEIDKNGTEDNLRLYRLVSLFVYKMGYVNMDLHYFRNKLNRAPKSLKELLYLNSKLPPEKRWTLAAGENSLYHMQGNDGEYNLKFISCEGFCEAVYNIKGILLTEENDPVNMGTFNYCAGMKEANAHMKFDVLPYLNWGNSPNSPQNNRDAIRKGVELAGKKYKQNIYDVLKYRNKIMNTTNPGSI